jgi:hypothetical protein
LSRARVGFIALLGHRGRPPTPSDYFVRVSVTRANGDDCPDLSTLSILRKRCRGDDGSEGESDQSAPSVHRVGSS